MPVIKTFNKDQEKGRQIGEQISALLSQIGITGPKTSLNIPAFYQFYDGAGEVVFCEVHSGRGILPTGKVTELGKKIETETEGILIHFIPQSRYFLSGVGEL